MLSSACAFLHETPLQSLGLCWCGDTTCSYECLEFPVFPSNSCLLGVWHELRFLGKGSPLNNLWEIVYEQFLQDQQSPGPCMISRRAFAVLTDAKAESPTTTRGVPAHGAVRRKTEDIPDPNSANSIFCI